MFAAENADVIAGLTAGSTELIDTIGAATPIVVGVVLAGLGLRIAVKMVKRLGSSV